MLSRSELAEVRFLNFPEWQRRSGGTRAPAVFAKRLRTETVADQEIKDACATVAQRFSTGIPVPPILVVRADDASPMVVLEGCVRLTAVFYGSRGEPGELEVLLGQSPRMRDWQFLLSPRRSGHCGRLWSHRLSTSLSGGSVPPRL